jgi:hypothetical protein
MTYAKVKQTKTKQAQEHMAFSHLCVCVCICVCAGRPPVINDSIQHSLIQSAKSDPKHSTPKQLKRKLSDMIDDDEIVPSVSSHSTPI